MAEKTTNSEAARVQLDPESRGLDELPAEKKERKREKKYAEPTSESDEAAFTACYDGRVEDAQGDHRDSKATK